MNAFDRQRVRASRALLFPGPQPPLSHFGVTLQRHVVATGLRYAFYHLGLPMPERPPVSIVQLRLYLDASRLRHDLEGAAGRNELIGALLDPAGSGRLPRRAGRVAAAVALHRARQRLLPRRRFGSGPSLPSSSSPAAIWEALHSRLSALQPALSEALLADLLAALRRRADRARGRQRPPCSSLEGWRWLTGRETRLDRLGSPDPLSPSWAEDGPPAEPARAAHSADAPPPHRARGRFRETYRGALDSLRPLYRAFAETARDRGWIDRTEDAFFVPFDLAGDLGGEREPGWLRDAAAANRREYESLLKIEGPPDILTDTLPEARPVESDWDLAPVAPLD